MDKEIRKLKVQAAFISPSIVHLLIGKEIRIEDFDVEKEQIYGWTDGKIICLAKSLLKDTSKTLYVLFHEVLHVLLNHHKRKGNKNYLLWNLAGDVVINTLLDRIKQLKRPQGVITAKFVENNFKIKVKEDDTTETLYYKLLKSKDPDEVLMKIGYKGDIKGSDEQGRIGYKGDIKGSGEQGGNVDEWVDSFYLGGFIEELKNKGIDPGVLDLEFDLLIRRRKTPRQELAEITRSVVPVDFTNKLNVKKYGLYERTGIFYPTPISIVKKPIICVVDSSGSTYGSWKDFLTEVINIVKERTEVILVEIDAKIKNVERIKKVPKKLKLKGGGGTDFKEFFKFNWIKEVKLKKSDLKRSVIFFFTDLDAYNVPRIPPREIDPCKFYWILVYPQKIPWGKKIDWWRDEWS